MPTYSTDRLLSPHRAALILRVGAALCFIGHGAFGIMTKAAWVPYFAVVGIGADRAYQLMPLIGTVDVLCGIAMLVWPTRAVTLWMFVWAVWTACLRPLAGEGVWEAVERAGNYGVPAALLMLFAAHGWISRARVRALTPEVLNRARVVLAVSLAMLLAGHGALSVLGKHAIVANYASVLGTAAPNAARYLGVAEIIVACAVLFRRAQQPTLLLGVALWKLASESLFVAAGASAWEVVERGGSYAVAVALAVVVSPVVPTSE